MKSWLVIPLVCLVFSLSGRDLERIRVPANMEFAGIKLRLTEGARAEIQKDVDALRASEKYFNIKLDRVNLYFPIIERIFEEEDLPEDFKYLVIQESALISDAVSSANAVGFWQFKDVAAREVGLRIDRNLDERLNIVSATHGAAKYLKRQNFFFDNWVYALLAYNTGRGGAKKYVDEQNFGVKRMKIDRKTHWYVKKFLAHKIAFEDEIGGNHSDGLYLIEYMNGGSKTLPKIAREFDMDSELLTQYNKWLRRGAVPNEKPYAVIIPVSSDKMPKKVLAGTQASKGVVLASIDRDFSVHATNIFVTINGVDAIIANDKDKVDGLASKGDLSDEKFRKFNDLRSDDQIVAGKTYFLGKKKSKATVFYHTVQHGESLWSISQKYGIKLTALAKKNRMSFIDEAEPGRVLWLRKKRPKNVAVAYKPNEVKPQEKASPKMLSNGANPSKVKEVMALAPVTTSMSGTKALDEIPDYHVVKPKETLYSIGMHYGLTLNHLTKLNQMTEETPLMIGQRLKLTGEYPVATVVEEKPKPAVESPAENPVTEPGIPDAEEVTTRFHMVESGDTMYGIAAEYKVSLQALLAANGMEANDAIKPGQKVQLPTTNLKVKQVAEQDPPKGAVAANDTSYHEVKNGDTMYGIARKYGLSLKELMTLNDKTETNLRIGEKLKVSK